MPKDFKLIPNLILQNFCHPHTFQKFTIPVQMWRLNLRHLSPNIWFSLFRKAKNVRIEPSWFPINIKEGVDHRQAV